MNHTKNVKKQMMTKQHDSERFSLNFLVSFEDPSIICGDIFRTDIEVLPSTQLVQHAISKHEAKIKKQMKAKYNQIY